MPKYTSEKFWELYKNLPQELKDAASAEETGNNIYEACKRNGAGEHLGDIVEYTGQVLIGVLPPDDFQAALEKEVGLKKDAAKKVAQEISRFIFFPVKESLALLYQQNQYSPISSSLPKETTPRKPRKETVVESSPVHEEKPKRSDSYRESVE